MRQFLFGLVICVAPMALHAESIVINGIVYDHVLPRFKYLASTTETLATIARADCRATSGPLRAQYNVAFDAWVSASHLRFGPTEIDDRAFALAFWPDSRGKTPKALGELIADQDPIADNADRFANVSIAARGFYALEFLLFDDTISTAGADAYRCTLIRAIAADTANISRAISNDWIDDYSKRLLEPASAGTYRSDAEALQELLKALSTGLQFTSEARLGRPLGTYQKPRPTRAEAWRSGRSARHVWRSLSALRDLGARLAGQNAGLAAELDAGFARALAQLDALDDPVFAGVSDPQTRLKIEVVQQSVERIRTVVREQLGPELGVAAGFNSLDGD